MNLKRCTPFGHETFAKLKRQKYYPLNVNWVSRLVSKLCYPNSETAARNSAFLPKLYVHEFHVILAAKTDFPKQFQIVGLSNGYTH